MFHSMYGDTTVWLVLCSRCIAISSLGIFMYEELSHDIMHPKLKEAVNTLLSTLKVHQLTLLVLPYVSFV